MKKPIPTISAEAEILANKISGMEPGDILTYEDMSSAIGSDIKESMWVLRTAKNRALNDNKISTVTIATVGIKRCEPSDYADLTAAGARRIRREAKRTLKRSLAMSEEEYHSLSQEKRERLDMSRANLRMTEYLQRKKQQEKIKKLANTDGSAIRCDRIIEKLSGK